MQLKQKVCQYCGKLYTPLSNNSKYCKGPHYATCPICGKTFEITNDYYYTHKIKSCTSYECRKVARTRTSIEKYGITAPGNNPNARKKARKTMQDKLGVPYAMMSTEVRNKSKRTLIKRYGVDNIAKSKESQARKKITILEKYNGVYAFNTPEVVQKQKQTLMERYGVDCAFKSEEIRKKGKETCLQRYGSENAMSNDKVKQKRKNTILYRYGALYIDDFAEKARQTCLTKFGVPNAMKSDAIIQKGKDTRLKRYGCYQSPESKARYVATMQERYGVPYACLLPNAQEKRTISKTNLKFMQFLIDNNVPVCQSDLEFHISRRSYDIKIPNTNILVELDPTYTHNSYHNMFSDNGIPKQYHKLKSELARQNGYRCIHVFDWNDWQRILMLVQPTKRIYARNTSIYVIKNSKVINTFLNANHLQGTVRGQLLCLALVYNDDIVQMMTFGKPRYNKNYDCELLRLCTKNGYTVVGGASKLFKYASSYLSLGNVISYCDLSKFTGDVYEKIGMHLHHNTSPAKVWSKKDKYITANMLTSRGYDQLFGTDYGKGTSNEQLMLDNGWLPVYDCGQAVYTLDCGM